MSKFGISSQCQVRSWCDVPRESSFEHLQAQSLSGKRASTFARARARERKIEREREGGGWGGGGEKETDRQTETERDLNIVFDLRAVWRLLARAHVRTQNMYI